MSVITTPRHFTETAIPSRRFGTPFGLFSVTETASPDDPHWVNGLTWEHPTCLGPDGMFGECGVAITPHEFPKIHGSTSEADAITVYGTYNCSLAGSDLSRASERARMVLERHEQEFIEEAISTGSLGNTPVLQDGAAVTVLASGAAVAPRIAIGLLSQHAGEIFGVEGATIHAPRISSGALTTDGLLIRNASRFETATGELVAFGAGYDNSSPTGVAAGTDEAWLYITPPVMVIRSEITDLPPASDPAAGLDRSTNDLTTLSYRNYLVGWDDCAIAAVLVDLTDAPAA